MDSRSSQVEIVSGIHKVDGVRVANCYLVVSTSGVLLVDTGMPGSARKIVNYIKKTGRSPNDLKAVVFTHCDADHIGSADSVKRLTGCKLAIHEADAPTLSGRGGFRPEAGFLGKIITVLASLMGFRPVRPDLILKDGDEIGGLRVIHSPGHTAGSISLYLPGKALFTGDTVLADSKGNPKPPDKNTTPDMAKALSSLNRLSELEFDVLLPGHGPPVVGGASVRLKEIALCRRETSG